MKVDSEDKAPRFWDELVPELIHWLSAKVLDCGFYTIFPNERPNIYRFIEANREYWIRALQELVYILVQVIAVIQHKTNTFGSVLPRGHRRWLEGWVETYEKWYTGYSDARRYLERIILNSFDIVMAWVFDYLAQRTLHIKREYRYIEIWPHGRSEYYNEWKAKRDPDILCALEKKGMVKPLDTALDWEFLIDTKNDKMKVMADFFLTCKVEKECGFDAEIKIVIGVKYTDTILRIPDPEYCVHICKDLPDPSEDYDLRKDQIKYVYAHAHMTTAVGHDLYCSYNSTHVYMNKVRMECHPLVVEKFITDRQYVNCKSKNCKTPTSHFNETENCCTPVPLRSRSPWNKNKYTHCEIVMNMLSTTDPEFKINETKTITKAYTMNDSMDAKPLGA